MVTSVKVDDSTKSRLERLQAEIRLKTGRRVTQQEVFARLVEHAVESEADLVDSFRGTHVPSLRHDHDRSFTDATIAALCDSRGVDTVLSFDTDLDGLVDHIEPGA